MKFKVPHIIQQNDLSCGVTAYAMLLSWKLGKTVSWAECVGQFGNAFHGEDMLNYARGKGINWTEYDSVAVNGKLLNQFKFRNGTLPILQINTPDMDHLHFVIGISDDWNTFHDPGSRNGGNLSFQQMINASNNRWGRKDAQVTSIRWLYNPADGFVGQSQPVTPVPGGTEKKKQNRSPSILNRCVPPSE